jgi:hypothetical protein
VQIEATRRDRVAATPIDATKKGSQIPVSAPGPPATIKGVDRPGDLRDRYGITERESPIRLQPPLGPQRSYADFLAFRMREGRHGAADINSLNRLRAGRLANVRRIRARATAGMSGTYAALHAPP